MENCVGIYVITSPASKIYVGQSWTVLDRQEDYRCHDCKSQRKLYNSLKAYGWSAHKFEAVLDFTPDVTQEELDWWEQMMIDYHRREGDELLNIREAGSVGKMAEETKEKE